MLLVIQRVHVSNKVFQGKILLIRTLLNGGTSPGTFTQVQFYCSCNVFERLYVLLILFLKQVFET